MIRILLLLCVSTGLWAQSDFKIAAAGKTIEFREIDKLTVVGYAGSDLTVEGTSARRDQDDRAAGLRRISASGLKDNTGLGISIVERDGRIIVEQVGGDGKSVTVKVPNSATVKVEQSTYRGDDLTVRDFAGDLDVSMMYHNVKLENVAGPVAVNAVYADIVAVWNTTPTKEVRLHSSYSNVDVTLPAAAKLNLRLSSGYGNMYTDFDIQMKANTTPTATVDKRTARADDDCNQLTGTINGGGALMALTATYDNLYIRKK